MMASICMRCQHNIKGICRIEAQPVRKNRKSCRCFERLYQQLALFDAIGNDPLDRDENISESNGENR